MSLFEEEDEMRMDLLVSSLTDWMNKYADDMGMPGEEILDSFAVAFNSVDQMEKEQIQDPIKVQFEFDLDSWTKLSNKPRVGAERFDEVVSTVNKQGDWDELTLDDWDRLLGLKTEILDEMTTSEIIEAELEKINLDDPFSAFITTLDEEELMEITPEEWRDFMRGRTPSEIKHVLDELDFEMILHVANVFSEEEIGMFLDGLSEDDWYETTPDEW